MHKEGILLYHRLSAILPGILYQCTCGCACLLTVHVIRVFRVVGVMWPVFHELVASSSFLIGLIFRVKTAGGSSSMGSLVQVMVGRFPPPPLGAGS